LFYIELVRFDVKEKWIEIVDFGVRMFVVIATFGTESSGVVTVVSKSTTSF